MRKQTYSKICGLLSTVLREIDSGPRDPLDDTELEVCNAHHAFRRGDDAQLTRSDLYTVLRLLRRELENEEIDEIEEELDRIQGEEDSIRRKIAELQGQLDSPRYRR